MENALSRLYEALHVNAEPISKALAFSPPVDSPGEAARHCLNWLMDHRDVLDSIMSIMEGWSIDNLRSQSAAIVAMRLKQIADNELAEAGIDYFDIRDAVYEVILQHVRKGGSSTSREDY